MDGRQRPWGYEVRDRKLVVNEREAAVVRSIFERFVASGSATVLARKLRREGVRSNRGSVMPALMKGFPVEWNDQER